MCLSTNMFHYFILPQITWAPHATIYNQHAGMIRLFVILRNVSLNVTCLQKICGQKTDVCPLALNCINGLTNEEKWLTGVAYPATKNVVLHQCGFRVLRTLTTRLKAHVLISNLTSSRLKLRTKNPILMAKKSSINEE